MKPKKLIFDFDGVIVDSFELGYQITKNFDSKLEKEEYRSMFKGNIFKEMKKHKELLKNYNFDEFFRIYRKEVLDIMPVDGIEDVLDKYMDNKISIVSSSDSSTIKLYLEKYNLDKYFSEILGGEIKKLKTVKLQSIHEKNRDKEVYFITDTLGDILEGNKIGINCIGITWGFHDAELLEIGNPFAIANNILELKNLIIN